MYQPPRNLFSDKPQTPPPPTSMAPPPAPATVSARGSSTGGTGFGFMPDLSGLTPEQLGAINNLTYSVPLGGYLYRDTANDPTSAYVRDYYGHPMTGGQSGANRAAMEYYNLIGEQPTIARGSPALNQFNAASGTKPAQGPSLTERMGARGPYGGPFTFPGYNPFQI